MKNFVAVCMLLCVGCDAQPTPQLEFHIEDPVLQAAFTEASRRLYDASGVEFKLSDTGVPIVFVDKVECGYGTFDVPASDANGCTYKFDFGPTGMIMSGFFNERSKGTALIAISVRLKDSSRLSSTLIHEMFHTVGIGHHYEGIRNPSRPDDQPILASDLEPLCSKLDCAWFNPE